MPQDTQSTVDWARHQIRIRLDEWDEFEALANSDLDADSEAMERYDTLDERTCYAFQEIMKIALHAQIEIEDETNGYDSAQHILSLMHYLTGDPEDIEVIVRD